MAPLTLNDWVIAAKNESSKNNHHANYQFETAKDIFPPDLGTMFDGWIGKSVDVCTNSHEVLERFIRCHGFTKLAGAPVDPTTHGLRLFCVKSWKAVYWVVQEEEVTVPSSEGTEIGETLRKIRDLLVQPERDVEAEAALAELESELCAELAELVPATPTVPAAPAAPNPPGTPQLHFKKADPASQHAHPTFSSPTPAEIEVTWVAPYEPLLKALGDDLTALVPATSRDDLLARVINVMGLLVYDRAEWDARLVFIFDPGSFKDGELRRPTLFSGGFPECYASAYPPDGWGRTARLDDGSADAGGEGVPEAVCHGNILKRASTLHYVGLLTPAMYHNAGKPNPSLVARKRFQPAAPPAHTGP